MTAAVKGLTLWQPWATAIAAGAKTIETRGQRTSWRGDVLVHASKATTPLEVFMHNDPSGPVQRSPRGTPLLHHGDATWPMPLGDVVAVAKIIDCVPILSPNADTHHARHLVTARHAVDRLLLCTPSTGYHDTGGKVDSHFEWATDDVSGDLRWGDYSHGRFGWLLDDVRPLIEPVPWELEGDHPPTAAVPARGMPGLWVPPDPVLEAVRRQVRLDG